MSNSKLLRLNATQPLAISPNKSDQTLMQIGMIPLLQAVNRNLILVINYQDSALLNILKGQPEGIKEYDLLMLLRSEQPEGEQVALFDSLLLFQQHFLLFHTLYQLDEKLRVDNAGHLIIEVLNIQWLPYVPSEHQKNGRDVINIDPLRNYYLDISQLESTSNEDVENLLASFWISFNADNQKAEALALFELDELCDLAMIKIRYRQLLTAHHPDKGGSVTMTQSINDAMRILKRCYS